MAIFTNLVKICSLVLVAICKVVAMSGRDTVSCGTHEGGAVVVIWSGINIGSFIHVLRIPIISNSWIKSLVSSNVNDARPDTIGSRSLGLRLCSFSHPFLVCFGLLQLDDPLLEWIHRVLILKFMIFNALDHSLKSSKLSLVHLILKQRIQ